MNKEEKINKIIEILDIHIRGAGDYAGVKGRTDGFLNEFIYPIINSESRILDVGAGDCLTWEFLKDKIAYWEGINKGVDLENTKERFNIKAYDFNFLPEYENNSFDLLISVNTFEHAYFPMAMLFEMNRITKKYLYIQVPVPHAISGLPYDDHPDHYFVLSDLSLRNIFRKVGLNIIKESVAGGEYQFLLEKTTDWY